MKNIVPNKTMTLYGTKIISDIEFPLDLSHETKTRYEIKFSSKIPMSLKESITCGVPLFFSHNRYVNLYSDRQMDENVEGQPWCYEVQDIAKFYWISGQKIIYYEIGDMANKELLAFWFIHQMLPLYMTLERMYHFIHAGAVEVNGNPILFIAPSMGGKSTLTDFFIRKGHTLISDDKVPTFIQNNNIMAIGSHSYHRPFRKFEVFGIKVENAIKEFKPIRAFYILERAAPDTVVHIEEVTGFEKFSMIQPSHLYEFSFLAKNRLEYLGNMLEKIRVFKVTRPWDIAKMPNIYEAIVQHYENMI